MFFVGTYDVPDTAIPGADFERENNSCTNNSAFTCSKLSLRYGGDTRPDPRRGSFTITYTGVNRVTRSIHVNFGESALYNLAIAYSFILSQWPTGYAGVYLRDESAGLVVGRVPNSTIALNNSLVLFGTVTGLVTCLENGTEAPSNLLRLVSVAFSDEECFRNDQPNSRPGLFTLTILANRTGQERIYFGDTDCSDGNRISDTFLFICKSYCIAFCRSIIIFIVHAFTVDPPATEGPGEYAPV